MKALILIILMARTSVFAGDVLIAGGTVKKIEYFVLVSGRQLDKKSAQKVSEWYQSLLMLAKKDGGGDVKLKLESFNKNITSFRRVDIEVEEVYEDEVNKGDVVSVVEKCDALEVCGAMKPPFKVGDERGVNKSIEDGNGYLSVVDFEIIDKGGVDEGTPK